MGSLFHMLIVYVYKYCNIRYFRFLDVDGIIGLSL
jgi:hypothetical protein